jgi:hypothetical protein
MLCLTPALAACGGLAPFVAGTSDTDSVAVDDTTPAATDDTSTPDAPDTDARDTVDTDVVDTVTVDTDVEDTDQAPPISVIGVNAAAGSLWINEYLADPTAAGVSAAGCGTDSEFIELINVGAHPIDLLGLQLSDDDPTHRITLGVSYVLQPAALVTLAGKEAEFDACFGAGAPRLPGFSYAFSLNNSGDSVVILDARDRELDRRDFGSSGDAQSEQRGSDDPAVWCLATSALRNGVTASPGATNDACGP